MSDQGTSSHKFSSVYQELRLKGDFCDAVFKVEDVKFPIHKVILCKCSPYFWALFSHWSTPDKMFFDIPGLSSKMMQLIIEFAYTDSVSVTEENVQELLLAADQLNVMNIVQVCCDFLGERLCAENCIGIWHFTKICLSPELEHKAYCYIIGHFEKVAFCDEFQDLSGVELADILERDDLSVKKESTAYEAVLHWIAHVPEERKEHLAVLLSKVRLAFISLEYIMMNVMSNELVKSNAECLQMVSVACQIIRHIVRDRSCMSGFRDAVGRPRLPNTILLAIGGWSGGNPTNGIEAYDVRANCWTNVTNPLECPRAYHGSAFINGYVYCVGGFDRVEHFNSVRRFDLTTHTWHEVAPMYYHRCYVSVTVLNGYIYAMGGFDGHVRLSTAERYRPETNQWSLIAPMSEQRSDASCTALHNKVYICGGFNGNECLDSCEYYSPKTNQWTLITPMNSRRSGIGIVAYADHIFAAGGFDGSSRLCSAEAYNPRTNTWHAVPSMMTTRSNFGIEVIDDLIFVVGGFDGFTTSFNVECYNPVTNEWSEACNMEIFRSALSCCVVSGLPNMAKYIVSRDKLPVFCLEDGSSLMESEESNSGLDPNTPE